MPQNLMGAGLGVSADPNQPYSTIDVRPNVQSGQFKLSPRLSASLDVARAFAACYVVLHHVADAHGWSRGPGLVLRFGQEAVLIFFLLSGFVIFANERSRAIRPWGYFLRRIRRIYPPLIAAILVSTLIAFDNGILSRDFHWSELLGTLVNLQDISKLKPGVIVDPYLDNNPLWSLSYEMTFYFIFPLVLRPWMRFPSLTNHLIGLVCCVAYVSYILIPNHWSLIASYFLIWWCGAMAAEAYLRGERNFRSMGTVLFWQALLCAITLGGVLYVGFKGPGFYPFLMLRHFVVVLVLLVLLFGPLGSTIASRLTILSKSAAAVASISYGLYVLHYPILVKWYRTDSLLGLLAGSVLVIAAAYVVDRQLNRYLPRAPAK